MGSIQENISKIVFVQFHIANLIFNVKTSLLVPKLVNLSPIDTIMQLPGAKDIILPLKLSGARSMIEEISTCLPQL